jgi:hypothetical protein
VTEALLVGAGVLVVLALAGFAIFAARKQGAAEASRGALDQAITNAEKANAARAAVDRMSDADVDRELRDDFRR